jgi:hypothetical protein
VPLTITAPRGSPCSGPGPAPVGRGLAHRRRRSTLSPPRFRSRRPPQLRVSLRGRTRPPWRLVRPTNRGGPTDSRRRAGRQRHLASRFRTALGCATSALQFQTVLSKSSQFRPIGPRAQERGLCFTVTCATELKRALVLTVSVLCHDGGRSPRWPADSLRSASRMCPTDSVVVDTIPRTLNGKKCEVSASKIIAGAVPDSAVSITTLQNPEALKAFVGFRRFVSHVRCGPAGLAASVRLRMRVPVPAGMAGSAARRSVASVTDRLAQRHIQLLLVEPVCITARVAAVAARRRVDSR